MRYILTLIFTPILLGIFCILIVLSLAPAPIAAEYWVREMTVIKHDIADKLSNSPKILIGGGSCTLFSIDTQTLTNNLKIPVINMGLHAGLPLDTLLEEARYSAKKGDVIILPLETSHYSNIVQPNKWTARNTFAWERELWNQLSVIDKIKYIINISPSSSYFNLTMPYVFFELGTAKYNEKFHPEKIQKRLSSFDDKNILARFAASTPPIKLTEYSAYNLDKLGNMRGNVGKKWAFTTGRSPENYINVSNESLEKLKLFVKQMNEMGIAVYFANIPYIDRESLNYKQIKLANKKFKDTISSFSCVIDDRQDLIFPLKYFYDTELHLNSEGRIVRTKLLEEAIKKNILVNNPNCRQGYLKEIYNFHPNFDVLAVSD